MEISRLRIFTLKLVVYQVSCSIQFIHGGFLVRSESYIATALYQYRASFVGWHNLQKRSKAFPLIPASSLIPKFVFVTIQRCVICAASPKSSSVGGHWTREVPLTPSLQVVSIFADDTCDLMWPCQVTFSAVLLTTCLKTDLLKVNFANKFSLRSGVVRVG